MLPAGLGGGKAGQEYSRGGCAVQVRSCCTKAALQGFLLLKPSPDLNRKRASDIDGRSHVRPNGDSVSGHPQSEPDTQDLPPTSTSGRHLQVSRTAPTGSRRGTLL